MTSEQITSIVIAIIGSGILTKIIDIITNIKNPVKVGVRMCLMKDIYDFGEKLVDKGFASDIERQAFLEAHKTYKALGGDGYADTLVKKVNELPSCISD